jgi:hypothetical protein
VSGASVDPNMTMAKANHSGFRLRKDRSGEDGDIAAEHAQSQLYYIVDIRPQWMAKSYRYITLWRANNAGYCWSLPWAGKYSVATVDKGGSYYAQLITAGSSYWVGERPYLKDRWVRFPVPCDFVDAMATEQPRPGDIAGNIGPILRNLAPVRTKLLKAAYLPKMEPADA